MQNGEISQKCAPIIKESLDTLLDDDDDDDDDYDDDDDDDDDDDTTITFTIN